MRFCHHLKNKGKAIKADRKIITIEGGIVRKLERNLPTGSIHQGGLSLFKKGFGQKKAQARSATHFGTIQNPINMMEMEHELVGKNLEEIRILSHDYSLPADACGSYGLLYKILEEFENDLHIHVHLENNISFPKAIALERNKI